MRRIWSKVEFLFIDEISMVPYEMLSHIDSRLRQLKKEEDKVFGGLNVVLFGDLMQLPPVRGAQVFNQPGYFRPSPHLWRMFILVELKDNMRQQGDTTLAEVLNALRVGKMTAQHFKVLQSKVIQNEEQREEDFAIEKAIHIYPTNQQVADHNNEVLEKFRAKGTRIYKIKAQDRLVVTERNVQNVNMDKMVYDDVNKTGGLPKEVHIFVGAKVMLRVNINLEKGLVNGARGDIVEIIWPGRRRDMVDENDIPNLKIEFESIGIHEIIPKSLQFPAKSNYGTIERRQLPLVLCFSSTVHKMQGCTVDKAVVYLGKKLFQDGQAYVALSRVRSLDGVRIVELDCGALTGTKPCNEDAIKEMERMREIQQAEEPR